MIVQLKSETFDNIQWHQDGNVKDFLNHRIPKNRILETFRRIDILPFSNINIRFSQSLWDFSSVNNLPVSSDEYRFNFPLDNTFGDILKLYVLNSIFKKTVKIRTLKQKYLLMKDFLSYAYSQGYTLVEMIPQKIYTDYFDNDINTSYLTKIKYKRKLLDLVNFYELNFEKINDKKIKEFLEEKNDSKLKSIKEANKTPEIPEDYLNKLIHYCKLVMLDENEDEYERCTAAIIILFSQIGFRTGEILTVKNYLKEELFWDSEAPLRYLTFRSYKHGKGDDGDTEAVAIVNKLSHEAYMVLNKLCEPYRKKINSDYLIVGKGQKKSISNSDRLNTRIRNFYFKHNKNLPCINTNEKYPELSTLPLSTMFEKCNGGYCRFDLSKDCYSGLTEDDILVYPEIRMFRVTVCTNFHRQGVPINYIKKHMNHLSEDMTSYYIRPDKTLQKDYSETIYKAIINDKSKLMGSNSDAFINRINSYIETLDVNLKANIDEVIKMVANKYPLREKVGGICIRCGDIMPCGSSDSTDEIYCAFGMCPNHCHMFFMVDISYNEFLNHQKIIEYNSKNGFMKAALKETNKIRFVVENSLIPELDELHKELERKGQASVKKDYPQLISIIDNYDNIYKEARKWLMKS